MVYVKLILICIRQSALMGLWQSGAELDGSNILRDRTVRHRQLKDAATRMLIQKLLEDLSRAGVSMPQIR